VLEAVGDESTAKALESLLRSDADLNSHTRSVIELTISRIRSRPGFRLHS
jgi:hypothetical protein